MTKPTRMAKCAYCCQMKPSSPTLAFFEYQGEDSDRAKKTCGHCRYHAEAHTEEKRRRGSMDVCQSFTPIGEYEHDLYYCGCRGWD